MATASSLLNYRSVDPSQTAHSNSTIKQRRIVNFASIVDSHEAVKDLKSKQRNFSVLSFSFAAMGLGIIGLSAAFAPVPFLTLESLKGVALGVVFIAFGVFSHLENKWKNEKAVTDLIYDFNLTQIQNDELKLVNCLKFLARANQNGSPLELYEASVRDLQDTLQSIKNIMSKYQSTAGFKPYLWADKAELIENVLSKRPKAEDFLSFLDDDKHALGLMIHVNYNFLYFPKYFENFKGDRTKFPFNSISEMRATRETEFYLKETDDNKKLLHAIFTGALDNLPKKMKKQILGSPTKRS